MGEDKARLVLGNETTVERQVRVLRQVCGSVSALGPPERFLGLEVAAVPDEMAGRGPVAGLFTGLRHTRTEFNLFLSCDLLFVDARLLLFLCRIGLASKAEATVPISPGGQPQPLCAVYRRQAFPKVRGYVESGENKVQGLISRLRTRWVFWPEIARAGFRARVFVNMNTREEYEAVRLRFEPLRATERSR